MCFSLFLAKVFKNYGFSQKKNYCIDFIGKRKTKSEAVIKDFFHQNQTAKFDDDRSSLRIPIGLIL